MWAVGIDRPYYPSIEFIDDEMKAREYYEKLKEEHIADGNFEAKIFIAKIEDIKNILTNY